MQAKDILKYVGQVISLDLANGKEVTGKLERVDEADGMILVNKPRMFIPVASNQQATGFTLAIVNYGHPMFIPENDELLLDSRHIITHFIPPKSLSDEYHKQTSGIIPVPSAALNALQTPS